jgi:hypothetical protein
VGFVPILTYCIFNWNCPIVFGSSLDTRISQIQGTLAALYEAIAKDAPNATIVVMGYPAFFPANPPLACDTGAFTTFIGPQMTWINGEIKKMDDTIAAAVATAQQQYGKRVRYVSESYGAFYGHELCTADPYYNRAVPSNVVISFHPNLSGNNRMAQLVEQTYQAP